MEKQKRLSMALSNLDLNSYKAFQKIVPMSTAVQSTKVIKLDGTNSGPFRLTDTRFKWQTDRCENEKPEIIGKLKTYDFHQRISDKWEGMTIMNQQPDKRQVRINR